ncbi:protein-L-isoaspartate O-methyltransferase [Sphingomonas sp. LaA6.9]|uniref:protein-L-isoaspartate O-methyltransferase family protein n=1 Tax=Sphingomonas sp. LaA6.9 TaxID=2919914 RepID=UPI001F5009A2|nr:methyltransferase domain-containing protein [Sphingomonas sp. LaA6.9]MCJ8155909.1 protein-L-isoaspartate O-methyltransferase [Sphingomonas sp. LaA6.9]
MTEPNFESLRRAMVSNQLRTWAVNDPQVISAMGAVARETFVPADRAALAYVDALMPIAEGRSLNTSAATGRLLAALGVRAGEKVLLVGAATGYAAALLGELGARVVALEENRALADAAASALAGHAQVSIVNGPLAEGWAKDAPYDAILIDGAVEHVPDAISAQLKDGGRIATGIVERGVTRLASGRKAGEVLALADFVDAETAILPGFAIPKSFVF